MSRIYNKAFPASFRRAGFLFLILVICLCVFAQMLGTPITVASVLTGDVEMESASEDFLILSVVLKPTITSCFAFFTKTAPSRDRSNFRALVFHPPQV
jgi:hypothetical protein